MDELIKKAIENELIRKPQKGFSDKVMNQLFQLKKPVEYKPIISKTGWIIISIFASLMIGVIFLVQPNGTESTSKLTLIDKAVNLVSSIEVEKVSFFDGINLLLVAVISLAIFLLLFFDSIFLRKHRENKI